MKVRAIAAAISHNVVTVTPAARRRRANFRTE